MKYTSGKIGLGLAGAVAAVGLMSAGVPPANAQIVLTQTSPVETLGAVVGNTQTYDFTYYMDVGAANQAETLGSGAYVTLTLAGALSDLALLPTLTVTNPSNSVSFSVPSDVNLDGLTYTWTYSGSNLSLNSVESLGYITVVSSTPNALLPNVHVPPGNFQSQIATNSYYVNEQVAVPNSAGTPLAPLPLPAAFWPGLMTLGGMAVVGGLRLRRRAL